ncbi:MAG: hypothetical protein ACE5R6_17785 [Candidatus Heimdallarchaeota archaeon]
MSKLSSEQLTFEEMALRLLVPFLMTLFFFQGFRTYVIDLYIAVWNIVWIPGYPMGSLSTMLVFTTPLLGLIVGKKINTQNIVLASVILTSTIALIISLELPYVHEFLASSLVVGFYSLFFPFYLSLKSKIQSATNRELDARIYTMSFAFAISYDILIRAINGTYDVSRTKGYFPAQFALTVILIALGVRSYRLGDLKGNGPSSDANGVESASRLNGVLIFSGIGALLFLELGLLANPHNILRWAQSNYSLVELALFTPLLILMITIAVLPLVYSKLHMYTPVDKWSFLLVGNIIVLASITCLLLVGTWFSVILTLIAQFFIILNLYTIIKYAVHSKFLWKRESVLATAFFLGLLILLFWDFMFAFTFTFAYFGAIFEGQVPLVLLSVTAILCITSTLASLKAGGVER